MCQLTPSKICHLTPTIPDSEKLVIDTDSVNFSIHTMHTVRLKLGTIFFSREMSTFPGGQITSISPTISVGQNQIFIGTTRNSHFVCKKSVSDRNRSFGRNDLTRLARIYRILPEIGIGKSHTKKMVMFPRRQFTCCYKPATELYL